MSASTKQDLIEQIDWERRESNAKFVSQPQTVKLLIRASKKLMREPGLRTVPEQQQITLQNGVASYALADGFKELISIYAGTGGTNPLKFTYKSPEDFDNVIAGYFYTFKTNGYIEFKFNSVEEMPSSIVTLVYYTKNIVLDEDGVTAKRVWENDGDTSRLGEEFDDFYIEYCTSLILRREGKKEWTERMSSALQILADIKEQNNTKTRRPRKSFGHYMM